MKKLGVVKKAVVETPVAKKTVKAVKDDSVTKALVAANKAVKAKAATPETPAPAEPKAKAEKAPKAPKERTASKFTSKDVFTFTRPDGTEHNGRLRVSEFQDYTFASNATAKPANRKTDVELCAIWQAQFPEAVTFNVFHVKGARRDYNAGKHSKMFNTVKKGDAISVEYGADGTPVTAAKKAAVPDTKTA